MCFCVIRFHIWIWVEFGNSCLFYLASFNLGCRPGCGEGGRERRRKGEGDGRGWGVMECSGLERLTN